MSRRLALYAAFAAAAFLSLWLWRQSGLPVALTDAPAGKLDCVSYTPSRDQPQQPAKAVTRAKLEHDLTILAARFRCVRIYSVSSGLDQVPAVARQLGLKVLLGLWIGPDPELNQPVCHMLDLPQAQVLEAALSEADVFFASLIFDYDEVLWLTPRIARVPYRFIFESALELMSSTQVRFGALLWHDPGPILSRAGRYPVFLQWYTALIPRGFVEAGRNLLHGRRRRRPEAGHAARRQGAPVQVQQHARGGPPRRLHQVRPESARRWSDSTKLGGCAQFEVDLSVLRPESCRN